MPRNGSGTYILPPSNPVVTGTVIESEWANDTMADIANALSNSIAADGQTVPTADLPMGGHRFTNVGNATSRNQFATLGTVQDGQHTRLTGITGVDNLVGTLAGGATSYVAGALLSWFAPATNTGPMTINYNGIGAKSLTDAKGLPLGSGDVKNGDFLLAMYTGTEFRLLSNVSSSVAADLYNLSITGEVRPPSQVYPALTIATASTVNIPAGSAWIVPPGNTPSNSVKVTWNAQTITMQFLNTSFTTFIVVDASGSISQIPGRAIGANFRSFAIIGVVEHITGVVNNVITRPSVFGDDGYRNRDAVSLLANTIINGGLCTPNSVSTLNLDVAQGTIFIPGGTANVTDSPNTFNIPPQQNIQFRPLAGQSTLAALTALCPVGSYDSNGAGVVAALPNPGDATIHRLFYLYGQYVFVFGQQVYTSVENALSFIAWDRTKFKKSLYLADATLIAEVVAIRSATNLNLLTQGAIVCPGGLNFSIGSPGGIAEAPIDGFPYGRKNAAWSKVLESVSPTISTGATITGPAAKLDIVMNPYAAGTVGFNVWANAFKWVGFEVVNPDDDLYLRSYNPTTGALRHTLGYDLQNGVISMDSVPFTKDVAGAIYVPEIIAPFTGDINTLLVTGVYRIANTATNQPIAGHYGYLTVQNYDGGSMIQVFTDLSPTIVTRWTRTRSGASWGPWYREFNHSFSAPQALDFNTVVEDGIYSTDIGSSNVPPAAAADPRGVLVVYRYFPGTNTDYIVQQYTPIVSVASALPSTFQRTRVTTVWGPWYQQIGSPATDVATDLNNVLIPGFYLPTQGANAPINAPGFLTVSANPSTGNVHQRWTQVGTGNVLSFERVRTLATWFPWYKIFTSQASGNNLITAAGAMTGYGVGAGGTVTQTGALTNAVTLDKTTGVINMFNGAWTAGQVVQFVLNNNLTNANVQRIPICYSMDGRFTVQMSSHGVGQLRVYVTNSGAGAGNFAPAIAFALIEGAFS